MKNRVYYGEYSLAHWIDLILKRSIVLPEYQRYFVWSEEQVKKLIAALKKGRFVPPVTIGAFKAAGANQNIILDGQQRLTSILLANLGIYPDVATYKAAIEPLMSGRGGDSEAEDDDDGLFDNVLQWTFNSLTEKGSNKSEVISRIMPGNYKNVDLGVSEEFLKSTFLGFSYLVPYSNDPVEQNKYYTSVFRHINISGIDLLAQESRSSLYFLDKNLQNLFDPSFLKSIKIKSGSGDTRFDFVRYLSLLSQYHKDGSTKIVARGYRSQIEKYYEEYILSVVGDETSNMFLDFDVIFPGRQYSARLEALESTMKALSFPDRFISVIDADIYFFGLIYVIVIEGKQVDVTKRDEIISRVDAAIIQCKSVSGHVRSPNALKYLKSRIDTSLGIYDEYTTE